MIHYNTKNQACNVSFSCVVHVILGLPWLLSGKESACNSGNMGSIPGSRRSSGERNCNPLHYSFLGNPMDRGAEWTAVHEVARVGHDLATIPPPPHVTSVINM